MAPTACRAAGLSAEPLTPGSPLSVASTGLTLGLGIGIRSSHYSRQLKHYLPQVFHPPSPDQILPIRYLQSGFCTLPKIQFLTVRSFAPAQPTTSRANLIRSAFRADAAFIAYAWASPMKELPDRRKYVYELFCHRSEGPLDILTEGRAASQGPSRANQGVNQPSISQHG